MFDIIQSIKNVCSLRLVRTGQEGQIVIEERIRLNRIRREQELRRHILLCRICRHYNLVLAIAGGSFISRAQAPGETVYYKYFYQHPY